jgi:hypothetical protein
MTPKREDKPTREEAKLTLDTILKRYGIKRKPRPAPKAQTKDGVLPYAPDASYGRPEDLKALVEAAHIRGLMVLLDVVYNHFGPDGNYLSLYAPQLFTDRHKTPWGNAVNYDSEGSQTVRQFAISLSSDRDGYAYARHGRVRTDRKDSREQRADCASHYDAYLGRASWRKRAADLLPVIRSIQSQGAVALREVAQVMNDRGVPAARGGEWSAMQVSRVLALTAA